MDTLPESVSPVKSQRNRRQERMAEGLCAFCDNPPEPGRKRCRACAEKQNANQNKRRRGAPRSVKDILNRQAKARREMRMRKGFCSICNRKAVEGKTKCSRHLKMQQDNRKAQYSNGLCRCGRLRGDTSRCKECTRQRNQGHQAKMRKRLEDGICQYCGLKPRFRHRSGCPDCLKRLSELARSRRALRLAQGLCTFCGENPLIPAQAYCCGCYWKVVSIYHFRNARQAGALEELFLRQGGRCAYSGRELTPGVDAELDHIIPESDGGPTEIGNLQWVHCTVNQMKFAFSEEMFLGFVRDIYEHRLAQNCP